MGDDMPVTCRLINDKYRIVGAGKVEMTDNGNPRDGGGYDTREECMAQARAMNASTEKDTMKEVSQTAFKAGKKPRFS